MPSFFIPSSSVLRFTPNRNGAPLDHDRDPLSREESRQFFVALRNYLQLPQRRLGCATFAARIPRSSDGSSGSSNAQSGLLTPGRCPASATRLVQEFRTVKKGVPFDSEKAIETIALDLMW